mgnify:FL=1
MNGNSFKIESSKVRTVKWWPSLWEARQAFERSCKRAKMRPPMHAIAGTIAGDSREDLSWGYRVQGVRGGHGNVYLEVKMNCRPVVGGLR